MCGVILQMHGMAEVMVEGGSMIFGCAAISLVWRAGLSATSGTWMDGARFIGLCLHSPS